MVGMGEALVMAGVEMAQRQVLMVVRDEEEACAEAQLLRLGELEVEAAVAVLHLLNEALLRHQTWTVSFKVGYPMLLPSNRLRRF